MSSLDTSYFKSDNLGKVLTIKSIKDSAYIFEENFHAFLTTLREYQNNNKGKSNLEVKRTLHNFLASSSTLIDHTRNSIRKCPEVESEYDKEVNRLFADSKICHFMKGLRNYITHYSLPLVVTQLEFLESDKIGSYLVLDRNILLKWNDWNKNAKLFLDENESNIKIERTFVDYYNIVANFHNWLEEFLNKIYKSELKEYAKFNVDFKKFRSGE